MTRILILGGNGYVGRELVRMLYQDHDVFVIDTMASGRMRFNPAECAKFRFYQTDITDQEAVREIIAVADPEVIVHLAAIHYIPQCEADPIAALTTNILGTVSVLSAAPQGCRFVFASSGAVYKPAKVPHLESNIQQPSDIYGLSKLHGEHYVAHFAAKNQLTAVVVRLFNVVGPGETNPHLLPELVAQLKAGHEVLKLGNLVSRRDYIHVKDAARGFATVALYGDLVSGETLTVNLGTSKAYSVREVVEKLRKVSNVDFTVEQMSDRFRKIDRPFLAADNSRIRDRFGWQPSFTIDDAVADIWREPELTDALNARYRS